MPGRAGAVSREYSPRGNANGVTFDVTIYFRIRLFRLFSGVPVRRATVVATRVLARLLRYYFLISYIICTYRIGARYDGFGEDYRAARPQSEARSTRG